MRNVRRITAVWSLAILVVVGIACFGDVVNAWPKAANEDQLIYTAANSQAVLAGMIHNGDSYTAVWHDNRLAGAASFDVNAERIDRQTSLHAFRFPDAGGLSVGRTLVNGNGDQFAFDVVPAPASGFYAGWTDTGVKVQRFSRDAIAVWTTPSLTLGTEGHIAADDSGGVFILAGDTSARTLKHLQSDGGEVAMAASLAGSSLVDPVLVRSGSGVLVATRDAVAGRVNVARYSDALALTFNVNASEGTTLETGAAHDVADDTQGGAWVLFSTAGIDAGADAGDLYLQHVLQDGGVQFRVSDGGTAGEPILATPRPGSQSLADVAADGVGGAYLSWFDNRSTVTVPMLQRVDSSGTLQWGAGLVVTNALASLRPNAFGRTPLVVRDGVDAVVVWATENTGRIWAQRVRLDGGVAWGSGGVMVSDYDSSYVAVGRLAAVGDVHGAVAVAASYLLQAGAPGSTINIKSVLVDGGMGRPPDAGGPVVDSGVADAGGATDAGASTDAGSSVDAGSAVDSGTPVDAGSTADAGTMDAGSPVDAGKVDAGAADAGPKVDAGSTSDAGKKPDAGLTVMDAGMEPPPEEIPVGCGGCGASGSVAPFALMAGFAAMLRRRRPVSKV